jgi:hypothetical protein
MDLVFQGRSVRSLGRLLKRPVWLIVLSIVWISGIASGFWMLTDYDVRPADNGTAPRQWPATSRIRRSESHPTLLMFLHPRCPCSRASLAELERVLETTSDGISAHVLFIRPANVKDDWMDTALRRWAAQIPGVEISEDNQERESRLFGASISGQTLLYDAAGRLEYSGGITGSRGHFGANPSSDQVLSLLQVTTSQAAMINPVYGCPLNVSSNACSRSQP